MIQLAIGSKVKFDDEKIFRWTVRAIRHPFVICTTSGDFGYYTIIDLDKNIRGPDNFRGVGYSTDEQIYSALNKLVTGDLDISSRNKIPLVIKEIK